MVYCDEETESGGDFKKIMKSDKLKIAETLSLPIEAVTQKMAFLGRTGSGKSYAATKLCELMLSAGQQVIALDPVGVWWGLRSGKQEFVIPVFGGLHGDIPLERDAGELIADLVVDRGISAVLDVSQMVGSAQTLFAFDFATRFFQRKKAKPSAVHLFIEECQEFVPQNISGRNSEFSARMLDAFERLVKLGRNFGIGASLISQRPQEVNKKALNQTECLFAFQMTGPQEREAIRKWVADKGESVDIVEILPKLKVGEPHVWSPQWLGVSETVRIARKLSDDVSSTPKPGAGPVKTRALSPIDLEDLRVSMAKTIEEAKANDAGELKREIARLKKELAGAAQNVKTVEVPAVSDGQLKRAETLCDRLVELRGEFMKSAEGALSELNLLLSSIRTGICTSRNANMQNHLHKSIMPGPRFTPGPIPKPKPRPTAAPADGDFKPNATQQRILDALAWYRSIGQDTPSVLQVGAIALIDASGGHFSNTVGPLSSNGLIVRGNGSMSLTDEGSKYARVPDAVGTLADYHQVLRERVRKARSASNKTVEMLDVIIRRGGDEVRAEEIGREVGIDHLGGHFSNTIGPLGTLGLIRRASGIVRPTEIVFPPGLS